MDSSITAAGRALGAGDPLGALKRVALRDDPPALALRGIAMAQLGEMPRARELLRRAARGFGPRETLERARCLTAEAEVALAARDLAWPSRALTEALRTFAAHGDRENAAHARLLQIRRLLLLGRIDEAEGACATLALDAGPARLVAVAALVSFEIALRRGRAEPAVAALDRAREAAARSGIAALRAEVEHAARALILPAARLVGAGEARSLTLAEVEGVLASTDLVVDGCRRMARKGERLVRLARRPVLFALLRRLAEAWPGEAARDDLIERAFGARRTNASHRARLRVELGRLRHELRPLAEIRATAGGFALAPRAAERVRRCDCSCRRSRAPTRPSWRCSPTARPGRRRRSRSRWAPVSGPRSDRSSRWRPPARCGRSAAAARSAGSPRPWRDSRRRCYSRSPADSGRQ